MVAAREKDLLIPAVPSRAIEPLTLPDHVSFPLVCPAALFFGCGPPPRFWRRLGETEYRDRDGRRSGLRRSRRARQPRAQNSAHGPAARGEYSLHGFPRGPDVHADARAAHDRRRCAPQRRDERQQRPHESAARFSHDARNPRRRRLPHRHVRQVAPRR